MIHLTNPQTIELSVIGFIKLSGKVYHKIANFPNSYEAVKNIVKPQIIAKGGNRYFLLTPKLN